MYYHTFVIRAALLVGGAAGYTAAQLKNEVVAEDAIGEGEAAHVPPCWNDEWHARLLPCFACDSSSAWAVVVPINGIYVEDYNDSSTFEAIQVVPSAGGRP